MIGSQVAFVRFAIRRLSATCCTRHMEGVLDRYYVGKRALTVAYHRRVREQPGAARIPSVTRLPVSTSDTRGMR